jgi:hypothetical protein
MRRQVLLSTARIVFVTVTLIAIYVFAPIGSRLQGTVLVQLLAGLVVLAVVLTWQIRVVMRSPHPALRGVEAIATGVPLLVLTFAGAYFAAAMETPGSFSEGLSRLDAAYFAVTVLATVGFGDISPVSDAARALVTLQMLVNLAFGGLILKVLLGAVRRRRDALENSGSPSRTGED